MPKRKYLKDQLDELISFKPMELINGYQLYEVNGVPCYPSKTIAKVLYHSEDAKHVEMVSKALDASQLYSPYRLRVMLPAEYSDGYIRAGRAVFVPFDKLSTFSKYFKGLYLITGLSDIAVISGYLNDKGANTVLAGKQFTVEPKMPLFDTLKQAESGKLPEHFIPKPCPVQAYYKAEYEEKSYKDKVYEKIAAYAKVVKLTEPYLHTKLQEAFMRSIGVDLKGITDLHGTALKFKTVAERLNIWQQYYEFVKKYIFVELYGGKNG